MDEDRDTADRARSLSASVYSKHEAMIEAIRLKRGGRLSKIPKLSVVVQDAIEELARQELTPEQFAELAGIESNAIALAS